MNDERRRFESILSQTVQNATVANEKVVQNEQKRDGRSAGETPGIQIKMLFNTVLIIELI